MHQSRDFVNQVELPFVMDTDYRVRLMKTAAKIVLGLYALAFALPIAQAKEKENHYRFELFGGGSIPVDKDFEIGLPQSAVLTKGTHRFSAGAQGGARLGYDGSRYWGMDLAYSYGTNASKIVMPQTEFAFINRIHQASGNALFYPMRYDRGPVAPYLTAGVGATFVVLSHATLQEAALAGLGTLKSETIFAFNAGVGTRIRVNKRFGVRLDLRDYMSRALRYGLPKTSPSRTATVFPVGGVFHQIAGTLGLVFSF